MGERFPAKAKNGTIVDRVSDCCSNPLAEDGSCRWCGKSSGSHPRCDDALLNEIEAFLCDWDRPSRLETFDLWPNIFKVARFVRKREDHFQ